MFCRKLTEYMNLYLLHRICQKKKKQPTQNLLVLSDNLISIHRFLKRQNPNNKFQNLQYTFELSNNKSYISIVLMH